jgi:hypothetical protein
MPSARVPVAANSACRFGGERRSHETLDDAVEGFRDLAVDAEVAAYGGVGQTVEPGALDPRVG